MKGSKYLFVVKVPRHGPVELVWKRQVDGEKGSVEENINAKGSLELSVKKQIEKNFENYLNELGAESAGAQGLRTPITTFKKLTVGDAYSPSKTNDSVYLLIKTNNTDDPSVAGLLRIGGRSLYFHHNGELLQCKDCFCVLDFYVREQRQGHGCIMFSTMLAHEDVKPEKCAIDRPTSAMLAFLQKHYALEKPTKHYNHFTTFQNFFQ